MKRKWNYLLLLAALVLLSLPVSAIAKGTPSSAVPTKKGWAYGKYTYYYDSSGERFRNTLKKIGKNRYYFENHGRMVKNSWKTLRGKRYYFTSNGTAATLVHTVKKKTYLFSATGHLMKPGLKVQNQKTYYVNKNGTLYSGWKLIHGKWYYFNKNKTMKTGWLKDGNNFYYLNSKGRMVTGWQTIRVNKKTHKFYFYPDGRRARSTWIDGKYLNSLGRLVPGKTQEISKLKDSVNSYIRNSCTPGIWSVYVKNLNTGQSFTTEKHQLYSASLIKAFTMGAVFDVVKNGSLEETSAIDSLLYSMIAYSDNQSFNTLIRTIGLNTTNSFLKKYGYSDTNQGQGFDSAGLDNGSGFNATTTEDCGKLLEDIYRGKLVSKSYSDKMLSLLKQQIHKNKIPSGVSGGTVYNKTGETDEYEHDIAIVESPKATYILCVMSHISNPGAAQGNIRTISNMVYQYFNN